MFSFGIPLVIESLFLQIFIPTIFFFNRLCPLDYRLVRFKNSLFASVTERYGIWEGLEAEASFKINCTSAVMIAAICRAFYRSFKENGAWYFETTTNSEHSVFCEQRCKPESNHASGILNAFYGLSSYLPFQGHHSVHFR